MVVRNGIGRYLYFPDTRICTESIRLPFWKYSDCFDGRYYLDNQQQRQSQDLPDTDHPVSNCTISYRFLNLRKCHTVFPDKIPRSGAEQFFHTAATSEFLENGNALAERFVRGEHKEGWVRMCDSQGGFKGIYQWDEVKKRYQPQKMFL